MQIQIPYGNTKLLFEIAEERMNKILLSKVGEIKSSLTGDEIVQKAMSNPIGSGKLMNLAAGKKKSTIIISDHTRPVPSKHIIPYMLKELRTGNPSMEITLLVATGLHRGTTMQELENKLGHEIVKNENIVVHDCSNCEDNRFLGILPSGARFFINKHAVETDLLLSEGFIEPHFFAGYSGGRKSVLPGICGRETILSNHCSSFIDNPCARTGILEGNPIHRDMIAAMNMVNLQYIVNVIINEDKEILYAFAGAPDKAHAAGCEILEKYCRIKAVKSDIVITSNGGAPLDQNIYQCVKGLSTAEATAAENAVIIMCAECSDGIGGDSFYKALKECRTIGELERETLSVPMDKTKPDQWQYQILARILRKHRVIFVTRPELETCVKEMKMMYARTIDDAMEMAEEIKGRAARATVVPDGVSLVIEDDTH